MATAPLLEAPIQQQPMMPDIGEAGENLPKELQDALRKIIVDYETEHASAWRYFQMKFAEADYFWAGKQDIFWDFSRGVWRQPTREDYVRVGFDQENIYVYPTNIYQGIGESLIAVLAQHRPTVRFLPQNFQNEVDQISAKAHNDAKEYIDRVNNIQRLNLRVLYLAYTHGIFCAHTRYVADSEKYGWRDMDEMGEQMANLPGFWQCPSCGNKVPEDEFMSWTGLCPKCGEAYTDETYSPPQTVPIPAVTGSFKVPKGEVTTTIYDGLQVKLPPYANEESECHFLFLSTEVPDSMLKAVYPQKADSISSMSGIAGGGTDNIDRTLRLARMEPVGQLYSTRVSSSEAHLVTWRRCWLRPHTYWRTPPELREQLEQLFPDGVRVEFAGNEFLCALNEKMNDHWAIGRVKPGVSLYAPSMGSDVLPLQKAYNFDEAIKREWLEYKSFEPEFVNSRAIDPNAINRQKMRARTIYPLDVPAGLSINDVIHEKRISKGPEVAFRHATDVFSMARFVAGAPPTLSGGTERSLKPTTYTADRDLALGRKSIHWHYLSTFWEQIGKQQVEEWKRCGMDDLSFERKREDAAGQYENVIVKHADLKAGKVNCKVESDERFPMTIEQQREVFFRMLEMANAFPAIGQTLFHPRNMEYHKSIIGLDKLYVPGEDDRRKQWRETKRLLTEEPILAGQDPMSGEPVLLPSIMPDAPVDNHQLHAEELRAFLVSAEGLQAKEMNPKGYANCILHLVEHEKAAIQKMAGTQQIGAALSPEPTAPGGGEPAAPPAGE